MNPCGRVEEILQRQDTFLQTVSLKKMLSSFMLSPTECHSGVIHSHTENEVLLYVPVTVHREQSVKKEYQQDATI